MARLPPSRFFPPADSANEDGLLALGGLLSPQWLLDAYQHGIFPWPQGDAEYPMLWWSPDPRAVIEFDDFHVARRLAQTIRSGHFAVTADRDFAAVIEACATVGGRRGRTWLTPGMILAYRQLFELGYAHSVETWRDEQLVGGVYGVALGGLFAAESMFYRQRDASKVALACLVAHLRQRGYTLLDIQQLTPHTERLGATELPRRRYLARLAEAVTQRVSFGPFAETPQRQERGG